MLKESNSLNGVAMIHSIEIVLELYWLGYCLAFLILVLIFRSDNCLSYEKYTMAALLAVGSWIVIFMFVATVVIDIIVRWRHSHRATVKRVQADEEIGK